MALRLQVELLLLPWINQTIASIKQEVKDKDKIELSKVKLVHALHNKHFLVHFLFWKGTISEDDEDSMPL